MANCRVFPTLRLEIYKKKIEGANCFQVENINVTKIQIILFKILELSIVTLNLLCDKTVAACGSQIW